jgi:RimJ/RimL family protein N-acetyltransferase
MEREWIRKVLARADEERFAICLGDARDYVGNVQLTRITDSDAEFHIFIGETSAHGQGAGTKATRLVLDYARDTLGLQQVYLSVHPDNAGAIRAYEKCGFERSASDGDRLTYLRRLSP